MTEQEFQNEIRLYLSKLGFTVFRINVGDFYTRDGRYIKSTVPRGFSDLFAVKDGKAYFFEVKYGKNKPSPEQINFIEQMKIKGCVAGIVYNFDEIDKLIL